MQSIRYMKIGMIAAIALFFSIIAFNNIIDFHSNWLFVQHVLSMDTTFQDPTLMKRAISNPYIQKWIYFFIIGWEALTAMICWLGCYVLLAKIKVNPIEFHYAKQMAMIGLFFGLLLYMVGFIIIAGEWFSMWQSNVWNGQMKAGLFISMIMFVMFFVKSEEN